MGIFDQITIDDPRLPCGPGHTFQMYIELEDSYGDFYCVDATGQIYRLTRSASWSRDPKYALPAPEPLDYSDEALEVYNDDAYILTFTNGRLTGWRMNEDY